MFIDYLANALRPARSALACGVDTSPSHRHVCGAGALCRARAARMLVGAARRRGGEKPEFGARTYRSAGLLVTMRETGDEAKADDGRAAAGRTRGPAE